MSKRTAPCMWERPVEEFSEAKGSSDHDAGLKMPGHWQYERYASNFKKLDLAPAILLIRNACGRNVDFQPCYLGSEINILSASNVDSS